MRLIEAGEMLDVFLEEMVLGLGGGFDIRLTRTKCDHRTSTNTLYVHERCLFNT